MGVAVSVGVFVTVGEGVKVDVAVWVAVAEAVMVAVADGMLVGVGVGGTTTCWHADKIPPRMMISTSVRNEIVRDMSGSRN